ncbi:hypothetical protein [Flavobacterium yafengii]|nr:hypothetical protein [Flavobacterium yafengii]MDI5896816.1 hypothetical protein [Flavobacterium yafengii]
MNTLRSWVVAKVQVPVKAKLWVGAFVPESDGKHDKTTFETTPKKRGH